MILLLGASGYIGRAFAAELRRRRHSFIPLTRNAFDYTRFDLLFDYLRTMKPEFLINAAGFTGRPEEDAFEVVREKAMLANALLPQIIARACLMTKTPWGHVSSGSIYNGAKLADGNQIRIERNLARLEVRELYEKHPERFRGFSETDEPNFSFRHPPCSFYSGTKALAEEAIRDAGQSYIWRPRHLFSSQDETGNYLSQLQREPALEDSVNSLSHLGDCIAGCLDLWEMRAPFGIYNVTNPGAVTTRQIVETMQRGLKQRRRFEFWSDGRESARFGKVPRSNCILEVEKLLSAGVKMRSVTDALEEVVRPGRFELRADRWAIGGHHGRKVVNV